LGKIEAKVVSAKALTEKQVEFIRTLLSQKLHMQVEVKAAVDPNVIGGFYVLVNGYIFDRTVRTDLNDMKERLKRGNVNDR
jgi:F-type H+-transporting ATPase subunit delta